MTVIREMIYVSFERFRDISYDLLNRIKRDGTNYDGIICLLRGGFYLSYFISRHLELPMEYIEISSYANAERREIQISRKPQLRPGKYLICDDIYDSGDSVETVKKLYPGIEFDIACVVSKQPDKVRYSGMSVKSDIWVEFFWEVI